MSTAFDGGSFFENVCVAMGKDHNVAGAWDNIEEVVSDEWEIGGLAMMTDAIRALVAGE